MHITVATQPQHRLPASRRQAQPRRKLSRPSVQVFKDFYLSKHSGRQLAWQNMLGHCIVRAQFPKGAHELAVSLMQVRHPAVGA